MDDRTDVVVVGGGLAGLVAATCLARGGKRVTVLERAHDLGGRAATHAQGEFRLNQGAHALYAAGVARRTLQRLGVPIDGAAPRLGRGAALVEGRLERLPISAGSLATTHLLGAAARLELGWIFARLGPKLARPDETVAAWLDRRARDPQLRDVLSAFVRLSTYANAESTMSARAAFAQMKLAEEGVLYLHGGWSSLVSPLQERAVGAGTHIVPHANVVSLDGAKERRTVTLDDGRVIHAEHVVLAVGPSVVRALTGVELDTIPVHAACLDVALDGLPNPDVLFVLGIDRPLYFSVHSGTARLAPPGGAVIHLVKYTNRDEAPDPARDEAELEGLFDVAQPGWRARVVHRRFLPRMVVANAVAEPGGRPDVDALRVPGVWLAGDGIGPEGMLSDAAVASAVRAAERILRADASRTKKGAVFIDERNDVEPRIALP